MINNTQPKFHTNNNTNYSSSSPNGQLNLVENNNGFGVETNYEQQGGHDNQYISGSTSAERVVLQELSNISNNDNTSNSNENDNNNNININGSGSARTMDQGGNGCTPRPRWCPTAEQIQVLEALFNSGTTTPSRDMIVEIAACLKQFGSIVEANVFYWFQNRKARAKRKLRMMLAARQAAAAAAAATGPSPSATTSSSNTNLLYGANLSSRSALIGSGSGSGNGNGFGIGLHQLQNTDQYINAIISSATRDQYPINNFQTSTSNSTHYNSHYKSNYNAGLFQLYNNNNNIITNNNSNNNSNNVNSNISCNASLYSSNGNNPNSNTGLYISNTTNNNISSNTSSVSVNPTSSSNSASSNSAANSATAASNSFQLPSPDTPLPYYSTNTLISHSINANNSINNNINANPNPNPNTSPNSLLQLPANNTDPVSSQLADKRSWVDALQHFMHQPAVINNSANLSHGINSVNPLINPEMQSSAAAMNSSSGAAIFVIPPASSAGSSCVSSSANTIMQPVTSMGLINDSVNFGNNSLTQLLMNGHSNGYYQLSPAVDHQNQFHSCPTASFTSVNPSYSLLNNSAGCNISPMPSMTASPPAAMATTTATDNSSASLYTYNSIQAATESSSSAAVRQATGQRSPCLGALQSSAATDNTTILPLWEALAPYSIGS